VRKSNGLERFALDRPFNFRTHSLNLNTEPVRFSDVDCALVRTSCEPVKYCKVFSLNRQSVCVSELFKVDSLKMFCLVY
jgi:hypothetical protein